MHTACINDFYDGTISKRKVNTMNNMDSNNMNNGTANGGSTPGASSDGDLDKGKADAAEKGEKGCGCNCSAKQTESREQSKSNEIRQPAEPSNPFPQSEAPSGDGTGIKAGGEQAE